MVVIVFSALASMPAALEGVEQPLAEADRSTGLVEVVAEGGEARPASPGQLGCCTLMASVAGRHSHWRLGEPG